jgi:hypothetical protein
MTRKFLGSDIDSDDLAMLQRAFDSICEETDKTSSAADEDARLVLSIFEWGYKDEKSLIAEVRRRRHRRRADHACD